MPRTAAARAYGARPGRALEAGAGIERAAHVAHPIYAGVYVFGRHEERMALVDGELRRRHKTVISPNAWKMR